MNPDRRAGSKGIGHLRAAPSRLIGLARTPLGGLALAATASTLCGLYLHPQGFVVLALLLAVAALGLAWPWWSVVGLGGSIEFIGPRGREGEVSLARLVIRNRLPWGAWGVSVRGGFTGRGTEGPLASLAHVPGWRTTRVEVAFTPACRGVYPVATPRLESGFPFGLWRAGRPLAVVAPLTVWPRTYPACPVPERGAGSDSEGVAPRDRAGNWGDPMGVRPYRRGDPLRRVHWGQTARHGQLIVCEVQSGAVPRVRIELDARPTSHVGDGPDGTFEWSIRVAASLAECWLADGADVELASLGGGGSVRGRGPSGRVALLDALARLEPGTAPGPEGSPSLSRARRSARPVEVIVTTDLGRDGLAESGLSRRDDLLVVLEADGFAPGPCGDRREARAFAAWVRVSGPSGVEAALRRPRRGVDRDG